MRAADGRPPPQRGEEAAAVGVVAMQSLASLREDDGVDGADPLGLGRQRVEQGEDGFLERQGEVEPAHGELPRLAEGPAESPGRDPEAQVEVWELRRNKGGVLHRRRQRVVHRVAQDTEDPCSLAACHSSLSPSGTPPRRTEPAHLIIGCARGEL